MPDSSNHPPDHRQSAIARGMMMAHRTTSMTMSLIVPVAAGYWADQKWGTGPWLASLGGLIGFPLFLMQLIAFADGSSGASGERRSASKTTGRQSEEQTPSE